MKTQKTIYLDSRQDEALMGFIGSKSFSPELIRLAKIGMQLDSLGISNIMNGLISAGYDEGEAIIMALKLIAKQDVNMTSNVVKSNNDNKESKRPPFAQ